MNVLVVAVDKKFVKVNKNIDLTKVSDVENASYWRKKRDLNSWMSAIKKKFPTAEIKNAKLKLVLTQ